MSGGPRKRPPDVVPYVRATIDPRPLLARLDGTDEMVGGIVGVSRYTVNMWRHGKRMLTVEAADRAACRAGLWPGLVWPDVFDAKPKVLQDR